MADIRIVHPETGGAAYVTQEALDHHLRRSGWMTAGEVAEYRERLAEREQPAKPRGKTASESEGSK